MDTNQGIINTSTNPLHQPGELYQETFRQVLNGLLYGINLHHGNVNQVTQSDILNGSDISPLTLDRYYSSTRGIVNEVISDIQGVIEQVNMKIDTFDPHSIIQILLISLRKFPLHLQILLAMDDRSVWERCLQPIVRHISAKQEEIDPVLWNEIYHVFCYQFHSVLKLWSQDDFANEKLRSMVRRVEAWVEANCFFAETVIAKIEK